MPFVHRAFPHGTAILYLPASGGKTQEKDAKQDMLEPGDGAQRERRMLLLEKGAPYCAFSVAPSRSGRHSIQPRYRLAVDERRLHVVAGRKPTKQGIQLANKPSLKLSISGLKFDRALRLHRRKVP